MVFNKNNWKLGTGDWVLGIGDWELGIGKHILFFTRIPGKSKAQSLQAEI